MTYANPSSITVAGHSVRSVVQAVSGFSVLAAEILDCLRVPAAEAGTTRAVDPDHFYPIDDYLRAYRRIETLLGGRGLEKVGTLMPALAQLPPDVDSLCSALESLDVAFHMNHRLDGRPMFDPRDGTILDGIGNYRVVSDRDARLMRVTCENPYPCRFDLGLVLGMARLFEPQAHVVHDEQTCRRRGDAACTYVVAW